MRSDALDNRCLFEALTFVILSVVLAVVVLQIFLQRTAGPLLATKHAQFGLAATLIEDDQDVQYLDGRHEVDAAADRGCLRARS